MSEHDRDSLLAEAVGLREQGQAEEARERLLMLAAGHPEDAEVAYQTAWVHEVLGLEAAAVPFYKRSLRGAGLSEEDRHGALLGLGSTYGYWGSMQRPSRRCDLDRPAMGGWVKERGWGACIARRRIEP